MKINSQTSQLLNNALGQEDPRLKEELLAKWALSCKKQENFKINYDKISTEQLIDLLAFTDALLLGNIFPKYEDELQKIIFYLENNKKINYGREQQFYPSRIRQRIDEILMN